MADADNIPLHNCKQMKVRRRELRNTATPAEAALWKRLQGSRLAGRKFRRQHSIGSYVVDFYCPVERLVVELDGEVHNDPFRNTYEAERTRFLSSLGLQIVRFENWQVLEQPELVLQAIQYGFKPEVLP